MPISSLENSVDCDAGLVMNITRLDESSNVRLAWLKTVNETTYEKAKKQFSMFFEGGGGLFDGDYKNFSEKRRQFLTREKFEYDEAHSRQILMYHVPEVAINAWRDCVIAKMDAGTLASWVKHMSADGGTLEIQWKPSPGVPRLRNVKVSITGGTDDKGQTTIQFDSLSGEKMLLLKRPPSNLELSGVVEGVAGDGGDFASKFYLPPVPPVEPKPIDVPALVEIPAKNFNRSLNIEIGVLPYGSDVIHNAPNYGPQPNMAEYDFFLPAGGNYDFEVEYAAAESRPVQITLIRNGEIVFDVSGLTETTGGWNNQQIRRQNSTHLQKGAYTLKLYRDNVFPHIRMLRFKPA